MTIWIDANALVDAFERSSVWGWSTEQDETAHKWVFDTIEQFLNDTQPSANGDLISRQDAIKVLTEREHDILAFIEKENMEYEEAHSYWCEMNGINNSVEMLESLPSAQGGDADMNEVKSPFMQQSPDDGADLISRQNALDILDEFEADIEVGKRDAYKTHREKLLSIHSAYHPLCALADRECPFQGKEFAWCLTCPHISEEDRDLVKKAVAEPKTGTWIFNPKDAIESMFTKPKCSECGFESSDGGNFCSNCGADMRGEEE